MPSMDFRVTNQMMQQRLMGDLGSSRRRLSTLQEQVSTGRQIVRPSDSPVGIISSLRLRSNVSRNDQISRNIDDATSWMRTAEESLNSINDQLVRVRDLALQAKNGGLDANGRNALASEMEQIRKSLISTANARYLDRPVFGGTTDSRLAYDGSGSFIGQAGTIERTIAPGVRMQINLNAEDVFGPNGSSLFDTVADLAQQIRTGNLTGVDTGIVALDTHTSTMQGSLAEIGTRSSRLESMQDANTAAGMTLKGQLSDIEDVDLTKAIMELRLQETSYQAALAATSRVIQPTLVDFLR